MGPVLRLLLSGMVLGIGWKLGGYLFDTISQSQDIQNFPADLKATWTGRSGPDEAAAEIQNPIPRVISKLRIQLMIPTSPVGSVIRWLLTGVLLGIADKAITLLWDMANKDKNKDVEVSTNKSQSSE